MSIPILPPSHPNKQYYVIDLRTDHCIHHVLVIYFPEDDIYGLQYGTVQKSDSPDVHTITMGLGPMNFFPPHLQEWIHKAKAATWSSNQYASDFCTTITHNTFHTASPGTYLKVSSQTVPYHLLEQLYDQEVRRQLVTYKTGSAAEILSIDPPVFPPFPAVLPLAQVQMEHETVLEQVREPVYILSLECEGEVEAWMFQKIGSMNCYYWKVTGKPIRDAISQDKRMYEDGVDDEEIPYFGYLHGLITDTHEPVGHIKMQDLLDLAKKCTTRHQVLEEKCDQHVWHYHIEMYDGFIGREELWKSVNFADFEGFYLHPDRAEIWHTRLGWPLQILDSHVLPKDSLLVREYARIKKHYAI